MLKSKLLFAACCSIIILSSLQSVAAPHPAYPAYSHTYHTHAGVELKPILNSFQIAAAVFLPEWEESFSGFSNSNINFNEEGMVENRIITHCILTGYKHTSCKEGYFPQNYCPESELYFKSCKSTALICHEKGYTETCKNGYIKDINNTCPENNTYSKCIPNPCKGFDYTLAEAVADGYIMTDSCLSGTEQKYQRTEKSCPGFAYDASNCGTGTQCRKLAGSSCRSGETVKYTECNACPVPQCELPQLNLDTYYCEGALRCLIP